MDLRGTIRLLIEELGTGLTFSQLFVKIQERFPGAEKNECRNVTKEILDSAHESNPNPSTTKKRDVSPPKKRVVRRASIEDYISEGDSSTEKRLSKKAPERKKQKATASSSDSSEESGKTSKSNKLTGGWQMGSDKNPYMEITKGLRVGLSEFKKLRYIDIRKWIGDKPTPKGIRINTAQWSLLCQKKNLLSQFTGTLGPEWQKGEEADQQFVELGDPLTRATVGSPFKGTFYLNLRKHYEKDGKILPTKKGIALTEADWQALCRNMVAIEAKCQNV